MSATRDHIERQKERLEFIKRDTRQYEEKIADILRKIDLLENELFAGSAQGKFIPALVRENIGIAVEVQFLEYEKDMRSSMNIANSRPEPNVQRFRPSNPVFLDTSGDHPYARVINPPGLPLMPPFNCPPFGSPSISNQPSYPVSSSSSGNSPIHGHYLAPPTTSHFSGLTPPGQHSPSTPTTVVYQNTPGTMISTNGGYFNINPRGSVNEVIMQPPGGSGHTSPGQVPERPNCLPLPPRIHSLVPTRKAPPPPQSFQMPVVGPSQDADIGGKWTCPSCSYDNHSALPYCEMCDNGRTAPPIGNIYTTFSSLYPKESSPASSSLGTVVPRSSGLTVGSGSSSSSPKSPLLPPPPLPAYPPVSPSSSTLGSPPPNTRHKYRSHLVSFGKKRHSKHRDKRGDK